MSIAENVARVRAEISAAAAAAGREAAEILLVAATKTNSADRVREAIAAGVDICGENRVQEMLEKNAQGAYEGAPLHFIGHLQKNKVRQVVGLASLIHGADSIALLEAISREYDDRRRAVEDMTLADEPDYEQIMAGSRELEELRKKYNAHPLAQAVNQSRRDFNEMMNAVNRELKSVLNPDGPDAPAGCSGSCAGCSGCS